MDKVNGSVLKEENSKLLDDEINIRAHEKSLDVVRENQLKSRSLEVRQDTRTGNSSISKCSASVKSPSQAAMVALNFSPNSVEVLEGTLTMRRSETRVSKFNTRLIESISVGDTAYMNRMLAMGANPNATCRLNHVSACHVAALYNNDALDLLLNSGAESVRCDRMGRTPLHLAAWAGNAKQIALLLNFPEALRKSIVDVLSPETIEEVKRHSLPVHTMTNTPCELNVPSTLPDDWSDGVEHNCRHIKELLPLFQPGWTALHAASARAQHHCVQLLLAAGADACAQDLLCRTPLDVAGCAHYLGHKIEVSNFVGTIRLLLKAGGELQSRPDRSRFNTPLHTAVELDSEEAIEELLNRGASATYWNSQGLTAMHVCVKTRNKHLLQLLANYEYSNENPHVATVDAKDHKGSTVLGAAVKEGWTQGVCIALGAGANITMKDNEGESPIHTAAALGNIDILQEILIVAKDNSSIDFCNDKSETALFKAIRHDQLDVFKLLLDNGARIGKQNAHNAFHIAATHGNKDILEHLLEYDSNITAKMINVPVNMTHTPLVNAASNNHPACVELLISKGAKVLCDCHYYDYSRKINQTGSTPLQIAVRKNHWEVARIIIENDINTVKVVNFADQSPLHEACCRGNRETIALLLRKGADLSGSGENESYKAKFAPIDMLMSNLSKPTEFMHEIFDSFISSQGRSLQEPDCKVTVDYGILVPNKSDTKQMRVINALVNTGNRYDQNRLLLHPLVQSFLYLKWKALLPFFYSILALHVCFVLSLNVYAVSVFYYRDKKKEVPIFLLSNVWKHILYLMICLITIQEIIFIKIENKRYLLCWETWLKFWTIALTVILPRVVSWESESSPEWARLVATVALLFAWFEMMILLSRFPDWGFYVLMFGKVANKVFKIFLSFVFLVFGFSICFIIQFRAEPPFEDLWAAFVKTMVMMASEYDYQSTISEESADKVSASITILRIIFLTFLILVSIVLMNLLVGVAVNDVNNLEMIGNIKRLEKQVEFITSLEDMGCHQFIKKILPNRLYKRWLTNKKWENVIHLRPCAAKCRYCNRLPGHIREAIFEKAQLQKKQSDEELGSKMFKMKLDEIHNAIVRKDSEPNKSERTDNTMDKIIEEIDRIRNDIEYIKKIVLTTRRRTISCNKSSFL